MMTSRSRFPATLGATLLLALAAMAPAPAATVLEYEVEGRCETDFTRMSFDGLFARVDTTLDDVSTSTIFDDGEQMMYLLLHDSREVMTMESDDDAIDFQGDVGRSAGIYAGKQVEQFTGMDSNQMLAQAQATQVAMCPEMEGIGIADPDYAAAATRCAQTMATRMQADPQAQRELMDAYGMDTATGSGRRARKPPSPAAAPTWRTTTLDRDGSQQVLDGITCRNETLRRGETVLRSQCLAEVDALPLEPPAKRRLARMQTIGRGMASGIAALNPEAVDDQDGPATVALLRRCHDGGRESGRATLRIRRDVTLDAAIFEPPAGYAPMQMQLPEE